MKIDSIYILQPKGTMAPHMKKMHKSHFDTKNIMIPLEYFFSLDY